MSVLEADVERKCAVIAQRHGCVLLKIENRTHWPDRLCLLPNGRHFFVEFKRPGGELSPGQRHVQSQIVAMGHACYEVDNVDLFKRLLAEHLAL